MADATYQPLVYKNTGGNQLVVASGGAINVETGGKILANGTQASAIAALTAVEGTTANNALEDVGASPDQTKINNNFADCAAKINAILTALAGAGITA